MKLSYPQTNNSRPLYKRGQTRNKRQTNNTKQQTKSEKTFEFSTVVFGGLSPPEDFIRQLLH